MNLPPKLVFKGDKDKAKALKGDALKFWDFVTNPVAANNTLTNKISKQLDDGTVLTAEFNTSPYGIKTGRVTIHAPENGGKKKIHGFVYTRNISGTIHDRFLQSDETGFFKADVKMPFSHVGVIDWNGWLTWNGTHRYSPVHKELPIVPTPDPVPPNRDLFLYRDNHYLNLANILIFDAGVGHLVNAGITGVVAGACMLKGFLVVFVFDDTDLTDTVPSSGTLKAYFISSEGGGILIGAPIVALSGFTRLIQCVAASKDGKKAVTIATHEEYGYTRESLLIDFEISIDTVAHTYNVVTTTAAIQNISAAYEWNITDNSRSVQRVKVARDYKVNTLAEFWIESLCVIDLGTNDCAAYINYNDQYIVSITDTDKELNSDDLATGHLYDFILLDTLDLRHDVFAYTHFVEDVSAGGGFTVTKNFYLIVGSLRVRYKAEEIFTGTYPNNTDIAAGQNTPIYHYVFRTYRQSSASELFYVPLQFQTFGFWVFQNNQASEIRGEMNYDGFLRDITGSNHVDSPTTLKRCSLPLIDKYNNKIIAFSPIKGVVSNVFTGTPLAEPETGTLTFTRDDMVIVKLDYKNRYYEAGVRQPALATTEFILDNEELILELKGVI